MNETKKAERDLRAELKEEHEWRMRLHDEVKELKGVESQFASMRVNMYRSLECEITDLDARKQRAVQRIIALGFEWPPAPRKS